MVLLNLVFGPNNISMEIMFEVWKILVKSYVWLKVGVLLEEELCFVGCNKESNGVRSYGMKIIFMMRRITIGNLGECMAKT